MNNPFVAEKTAFLFPGQGSQKVGMGKALAEVYPIARQVFQQADELLGISLSQLAWEGPAEKLNDTVNTQPALFVHSIAVYRVFQSQYPDSRPAFVAGHSLGELTALAAAGAMSFEAGLRLVRRRGELMKQAGESSPGAMAAILGLDLPTLEEICAQCSQDEAIVQIANDNCPGQVVISGSKEALAEAMERAKAAGARRVVPLAVSIAAHSALMEPVQAEFNQELQNTPFEAPEIPVIGNVSARPMRSVERIRGDLEAQLNHRVRWTESIQYLLESGINTFVELGSGNVLTGLLRRIDRQVQGISLGQPEDFEALLSS